MAAVAQAQRLNSQASQGSRGIRAPDGPHRCYTPRVLCVLCCVSAAKPLVKNNILVILVFGLAVPEWYDKGLRK